MNKVEQKLLKQKSRALVGALRAQDTYERYLKRKIPSGARVFLQTKKVHLRTVAIINQLIYQNV